jgi:hypothetical protein
VLGADEAAGIAAVGNLNALQARETLLRSALREAELEAQRDRERLSQREHDARRRSLAQRAARFERAAKTLTVIQAQHIAAFAEMAQAADAVVGVLPSGMKTTREPWNELLGPAEIKRLAEVESYRQQREQPLPHLFNRPPAASSAESPTDKFTIPPLTQRVADLLANCKSRFESFGPRPTTLRPALSEVLPPPPQIVSERDVSGDAVPTTAVLPDTSLPLPAAGSEVDAALRAAMKRDVEAALDEARREGLA